MDHSTLREDPGSRKLQGTCLTKEPSNWLTYRIQKAPSGRKTPVNIEDTLWKGLKAKLWNSFTFTQFGGHFRPQEGYNTYTEPPDPFTKSCHKRVCINQLIIASLYLGGWNQRVCILFWCLWCSIINVQEFNHQGGLVILASRKPSGVNRLGFII
jgi:hypothetical protein